jgi:hypothetical protein
MRCSTVVVSFACGIVAGCTLTAALFPSASAAPTGIVTFRDVPKSHWAAPSLASDVQNGLTKGYPDDTYRGDRPVTRYEMAVLLNNFVAFVQKGQAPLHPTNVSPVSVSAPPSHWAHSAQVQLVTNRYLPPTSPLIASLGSHSVTGKEAAVAFGQAVSRVSDRSLPVTKNAAPEPN